MASTAVSDMTGKNVLITGSTNGIGRATALALAEAGAKLYLLCRSREKGEQLVREIAALAGAPEASLLIADLGDYDSIREAVRMFLASEVPLHVLINNAGVINFQRVSAAGGLEQMFVVNHLGPFLLTHLLLDRLKASAPARIVNVASDAYKFSSGINFEDLAWERGFKTFKTYGHSKLANILITRELARRLEGSGVTVNSLHPGAVSTNLGVTDAWYVPIATALLKIFLKTPLQGAQTSLYLATSPEASSSSGLYYANSKVEQVKPWAEDDGAASRLWALSEQLVGAEQST